MLYGPIGQLAYVVRDIDASLRYWTQELSVGPFVLFRRVTLDPGYQYRGRPSLSPTLSVALGYSGEMQIELIEQHDDLPSPYREHLAAGRQGFHHVGCNTTRSRYDTSRAEAAERKKSAVHEGSFMDGVVRFCYFDTDPDNRYGGMFYEITDVLDADFAKTLYPELAASARNWDGSNAIREFGAG